MSEPKRVPVDYRWDALNWEFLKLLAENASLAASKYKTVEQYTNGRLEGEKSPINHIAEHLRAYIAREPHGAFDGGIERHLAAIAYNAMMEYFYLKHGGPTATNAFSGGSALDEPEWAQRDPLPEPTEFPLKRGKTATFILPEHGQENHTDAPKESTKSILSRFFTQSKKVA